MQFSERQNPQRVSLRGKLKSKYWSLDQLSRRPPRRLETGSHHNLLHVVESNTLDCRSFELIAQKFCQRVTKGVLGQGDTIFCCGELLLHDQFGSIAHG